MALKYNISNVKITAVLIHRLLGNYNEKEKTKFTDMFKQLKQWLFGTYRTESIPQVAYVTLWKSNKMFQEETSTNKFIPSCESYYKMAVMELFPDSDRMYVSLTPIEQPVYYMCRPEKIIVEDTTHEGMMPSPQTHQAIIMNGIPVIPDPIPINSGFVSLQAVADYMDRNFSHRITFPCESCGGQLCHTQIAGNLECTHFVHYDCLHRDFSCPLCNKWFY
jgi:hypothetical protein